MTPYDRLKEATRPKRHDELLFDSLKAWLALPKLLWRGEWFLAAFESVRILRNIELMAARPTEENDD